MNNFNQEEILDIVDENNNLTGIKKLRSLIHKEMKDWHRVTGCWVINQDKEILCQKRSLKKETHPGKWQSYFGGHAKTGQSYLETIIKELDEELGLKKHDGNLIPLYIRRSESAKEFKQVYIFILNRKITEFKFQDNEVLEVKWLKIDQLKELIKKDQFCNEIDDQVIKYLNL